MKLLGMTCSPEMSSNEILIKEALMGAEELGAEVEILRMNDLNISPCRSCSPCLAMQDGPEVCAVKDDAAFLYNKFMDSDGIILGASIHGLVPPAIIPVVIGRVLARRVNPVMVRAYIQAGGIQLSGEKAFIDERVFKTRVGAFLTDESASSAHWLSLGIPSLYTFTYSPGVVVIDHLEVLKSSMVVLNDEALARARKLGRNVAAAMGKPIDEIKWMGDSQGICPVCHCNLLTVKDDTSVECPVCGISGESKIENGKLRVTFSKEQQAHSRLFELGIMDHLDEIRNNIKEQAPRAAEVPIKVKKYHSYLTPLKPPSKKVL